MPREPAEGLIQIDLEEGFRPHFAQSFLERYDENSVFVAATADLLTARYIAVLVKADRINQEAVPVQLGTSEALDALRDLLLIRQQFRQQIANVRRSVSR
jgi:hypothetical protein